MKRYRIKPGGRVDLGRWDPADTSAFKGDKKDAQTRLQKLGERLHGLQELLYAGGRHKLLVVLQGMDTAGKDGTISHVFASVNPQGVSVVSFKAPTPAELAHDFLWRVHRHVPGAGQIAIFNRSHYEDVLIVRVHNLVPPAVWSKRYRQINEFERTLAESGTTILKFFLHVSRAEQKRRLQARLDDPSKRWKFNRADLGERKRWRRYLRAYQDAIARTSTAWAPWHVVPADRKWYRNLVVAETLVAALRKLKLRYPPEQEGLDELVIE